MFLQRRLFRFPPPTRRLFSSPPRRSLVYVRFGGSGGPSNQFPGSQGGSNKGGRWDPKTKGLAIAGAVAVGIYVYHLEQMPETGRWRFMVSSPESEAEFGETMRQEIRRELAAQTLPQNHAFSIHVRRIVARILEANNLGMLRDDANATHTPPVSPVGGAHMDQGGDASDTWNPDAQHHFGGDGSGETRMAPVYGPKKLWDVIVVNDPKVINAMASPGIIIVFTGILPVCQNEEGLAAVISHEIGHIVARHTAERSSSVFVAWGIIILSSMVFNMDFGLASVLQTYLRELPMSRKHEMEADVIGLRLMSKACYDPAASARMFERLGRLESEMGSKSTVDFFDTHPASEKRVKFLEGKLHEGYEIMAQNPQCDQFRQQLEAFRATSHAVGFESDGRFVVR